MARFLLGAALGFVCWVIGSIYPAPPELLARLHAQTLADRVQRDLSAVDWRSIRGSVGEERYRAIAQRASHIAAAAGNAVLIERDEGPVDTSESEAAIIPASSSRAAAASAATPGAAAPARGAFEAALLLCPRMAITNAPAHDSAGRVTHYTPVVNVNGVALAVNPTTGACLSSGFGDRNGRLHKGLDFHRDVGGPVMAGADGSIVEMKYRDDYGNMVLIDHGHGVYTRYAHLSNFTRGLSVGSPVHAGDQIGLMGNTASYPIPVHLHYEVLLGDYANPRGAFGLTPHSALEYHG